MAKRYILALDQGTTSSRALLVDASGAVAGMAQREFRQIFPQPGWVEHDPHDILASMQAAIAELMTRTQTPFDALLGIGITNQRETTVVWDRRTGQPVYNAIVWQSRQSMSICERLRAEGAEALVRGKTGLLIDAYFSASKIRWILDHVDGAQARAERGDLLFGTIETWLVWNFSGGRLHVSDASNAARTLLYDIHARDWDTELLRLFDVPRAMLPRVVACSERYGDTDTVRFFGAAVPMAGMAGDQQAALFGQACFSAGMAKNTYGTGCFMLMHTGRRAVASRHGLLTTIAWQLGDAVEYALEGSVFVGGAVVQWLRDGLRIVEHAADTQAMAASVDSSAGVYLVPAFVGLGAPYWRSEVRGAMFGLTRGTRREHLARAALEAMAYQTRDVLTAMEADAGVALRELRTDGGAIGNDFLAQFQCDQLGVPLLRPRLQESTALGAAYLAGLALGFWRDREEIAGLWQLERRFMPAMEPAVRERLYRGWQAAVQAACAFIPEA